MDDKELITWCESVMRTNKKRINPNYTRNNFEIFKKNFPNEWKMLEGKTLVINGVELSFVEKDYDPIFINGTLYSEGGRNRDSEYSYEIKKFLKENTKFTLKEFLKHMLSNTKISGVRYLLVAEKCFKEEYEYIMENFSEGSSEEREIIYRYVNDILPPKLNGRYLNMHTYEYGYIFYREYLLVKAHEHDGIEIIIRKLMDGLGGKNRSVLEFLEYFYKNELLCARNKYIDMMTDANNMSELIYIIWKEINSPSLCKKCGKKTDFDTYSEGYDEYCCLHCAREDAHKDMYFGTKSQQDFKGYSRTVRCLTEYIWRKYSHLIENSEKGRSRWYAMDHIIPVYYGYMNDLDIRIICHPKNLRIVHFKDNCRKGYKMELSNEEYDKLIEEIKKIPIVYGHGLEQTID